MTTAQENRDDSGPKALQKVLQKALWYLTHREMLAVVGWAGEGLSEKFHRYTYPGAHIPPLDSHLMPS